MRLRKGSPEAKAWGERMRRARGLGVRSLGRRREQEFFGPGAPLDPRRMKANPHYFVRGHADKTPDQFAEHFFLEPVRRNGELLSHHGIVLTGYTLMESKARVFVGFDHRRGEYVVYDGRPHHENPKEKSPKYDLVCTWNGCTFLRQGLTKKKANCEGCSHANTYGHSVSVVRQTAKQNPGASFHEGMAASARRHGKAASTDLERGFYKGLEIAHKDSAIASRSSRRGGIKQNPLAVFMPGNPGRRSKVQAKFRSNPSVPKEIHARVEGVIYNRVREVRAEKTAHPELRGLYKHPFSKKSGVQQLALDNGDLLLHSSRGVKLWERN